MQTINSILLRIKSAAQSHTQVKQVLLNPDEDLPKDLVYPNVRVWAAGFDKTDAIYYKFALAVSDRHQDNSESQLEALSDTALILIDLLALIEYNDKNVQIAWDFSDSAEAFYDSLPDVAAGHAITIKAKIPYTRNTCIIP